MKNKKGYVNAEDVLKISKTKYNEDNLDFETDQIFGLNKDRVQLSVGNDQIKELELASKKTIEDDLKELLKKI